MAKQHCSYMIDEKVIEKIDRNIEEEGSRSKSEFVERAIDFYCGYLTSDKCMEYLPEVLTSTVGAKLDAMENRMAHLLFKNAVELDMLLHVTAATNDIDDITLARLRGLCVDEVKRVQGNISLEKAVKFQKG